MTSRSKREIESQIKAIKRAEGVAAECGDEAEFGRLTYARDALRWAIGEMTEPPVWEPGDDDA